MSFIYPRTISISRPNPTTGIGALPYQGLDPTDETVLFTGIPASIQSRGATANKAGLPADTKGTPVWVIIIPLQYCPNGSILERDVITDDLGNRYQVAAAYWNSLGYQCESEKLQT
ncbi:hypothetical protein AQUSIP_13010 [Aquicella siphonis]|uniref:Uncharacterized protein n=1 Tax=Aquicella siphonis TaxID=254247 RepID=A0A5E4PG58_9COXI|nr:hypothetical protein [Aquicella siphonis]VVC76000.1 hypothetical protein AQUSIP_13010 [Aquicella siphonis]